jgi:drug/metabolite transporter (DMT)-like permease
LYHSPVQKPNKALSVKPAPATAPYSHTLPWMSVALIAHTGWGAYPVLARYLQTNSQLPTMSLLALGNFIGLVIVTLLLWPRLHRRSFRHPLLGLFAAIVVLRGVTNFLAARYTLSIYVQLITQMTPFLVALLSLTLLRQRLPHHTGRAITLCLLGAVLMMSGNIDLTDALPDPNRQDWLGITLALISSLALAVYMLLVRHSAQRAVPGEAMNVVQLLALFSFSLPASLALGEDWSRYQVLETADWLVFAAFVLGVLVISNLGQIGALRRLGAPLVSSLLAWRLVGALLVGALLLDERLTSVWQLLGAGLVLVTITWYLWQQQKQAIVKG